MTEIVRLRRLEEGDLAILHRWYQTPELWDHLVGAFEARSAEAAISYMRRWLTPSPGETRLAVTLAPGGALIGLVTLSSIDRDVGGAEFHIFLGEPQMRGQGHGEAATMATLEHAFEDVGLWQVRLRVLLTNERALRLYARLGFEPWAEAPAETVLKRGELVKVIGLSITEAVFRQRRAEGAQRWSARNVQRSSGW